jgi:hypothetical protein
VRFSCRINRVLLSDLLETVVVTENAKSLLLLRFIFACWVSDPKFLPAGFRIRNLCLLGFGSETVGFF